MKEFYLVAVLFFGEQPIEREILGPWGSMEACMAHEAALARDANARGLGWALDAVEDARVLSQCYERSELDALLRRGVPA